MKKSLILVALVLMGGWASAQPGTKNILFVGNSLTYFYGMPTTFRQMANAAGDKVYVEQHTVGNTGFVHHSQNPTLYNIIRSRTWDYVVLQPGSYESYGEPSVATVNGYLSKMKDSIFRYSPCAQVILYEISNGISGFSQNQINDYQGIQNQMLKTIQQLADLGKVPMSPAGEVLRNLYVQKNMMLWESPGDIHPNEYGSYAITCAMYNTIFKKPVSGMSRSTLTWAKDLDEAQCAIIQHYSDSIVLQSPPAKWRFGTYQAYALFNHQRTDNTVKFFNQSLNADSLRWEFADGSSTTDEHPTKELFASGENEWVILKAYKNGCFNSYARLINKHDASGVEVTGVIQAFRIYPNPAKDQVFIQADFSIPAKQFDLSLYNMSGQKLYTQHVIGTGSSFQAEIKLSGYPAGIYLLQMIADGQVSHQKIHVE